ncbi:hypothetical protein OSB04_015788 [Centaurea solstitialis]|uniref:Retrotransposon gag domain-containing protein n=1 Tax=Centaurea solstitialis TaxID=347529 RepID=A0AA38SZU5_9ASTR|nr:hypothetical protein OSB04_015788 [Centaurea solstitialis]
MLNQQEENPPPHPSDDEEEYSDEEELYQEQDIIQLANSKDGGIMDYAIPVLGQLHSGIFRPKIKAAHFALKPLMFSMIQTNGQFGGTAVEDPHSHLKSFMQITDSFRIPGVSPSALRLSLFPFSLKERARAWNAKSRLDICTFKQWEDEAVPDAWERYKELLRKCPHHGIPYCIQLETFYNGLTPTAKGMIDATTGGAFTGITYNEGFKILEKISNNNGHWADPRAVPPRRNAANVQDTDAYSALAEQVSNMVEMMKNLTNPNGNEMTPKKVRFVTCSYCQENHLFDDCPENPESVNYVGHNNHTQTGAFSPTYNSKWRDHPNNHTQMCSSMITRSFDSETVKGLEAVKRFIERNRRNSEIHDFQIGLESHQSTINLPNIDRYPLYKVLEKPALGVVYQNQKEEKKFMRCDEVHKYSDGTLHIINKGLATEKKRLELEVLKTKHWINPSILIDEVFQIIEHRLEHRIVLQRLESYCGLRKIEGPVKRFEERPPPPPSRRREGLSKNPKETEASKKKSSSHHQK